MSLFHSTAKSGFNQLSKPYDKNRANDFHLAPRQESMLANYSDLRALSPGTILHKGKIHAYIQDYRRHTKNIQLINLKQVLGTNKNPPPVKFGTLGDFFQERSEKESDEPSGKNFNFSSLVKDIPVVVYKPYNLNYIIPCAAIADYYFFGMPKLIKYILTAQINRSDPRSNRVYDPKESICNNTNGPKRVAYIRLEKEMYDKDAFKIARLAFDKEFWDECMKISHNLIGKPESNSFIKCGFPSPTDSTLTVYGRELETKDGDQAYLVYRIVKCTSPPPFEILIMSRDNPGHKKGNGDLTEPRLIGNEEKTDTRAKIILLPKKNANNNPGLPPNNFNPVGRDPALFNSVDLPLKFENPEQNNFSDAMITSEEELVDAATGKPGAPNEKLKLLLKEIGELKFTTEDKKNGKGPVIRIRFNSDDATKQNTVPTHCFEMIETALIFLQSKLEKHNSVFNLSVQVFCPIQHDGSPYSIFPIASFPGREKEMVEKRNFCLVEIKRNRHKRFRRILIYEISANGFFFYVMDIQPKYKRAKKLKSKPEKLIGFSSSKAVIFFRNPPLTKEEGIKALETLVLAKGDWTKLSRSASSFRTFKHTNPERMCHSILTFITSKLQVD